MVFLLIWYANCSFVEGLDNFPPPTPSTHYRNSLLYSHKDVVKMPHKPIYIQKNCSATVYIVILVNGRLVSNNRIAAAFA